VLNVDVIRTMRVPERALDTVTRTAVREIERREQVYRGGRPLPDVRGKTVILVDDGLATGATMSAAVRALRRQHPARIVVAAPTAAQATCESMRSAADDVICALTPDPFDAVGLWYDDFTQTSDDEVRDLLARAVQAAAPPEGTDMAETEQTYERKVHVVAGPITLEASLSLPEGASSLVLFAHGSGSSRFSPRNRYVARMLNEARIATLLLDLLTAGEEETDVRTGQLRFDITLLADRLIGATDWIRQQPETRALRVGYFGASTGAAAALIGAAERPRIVGAVVSRGGRPDLAGSALARVMAPTLLIVGSNDAVVLDLNRTAFSALHAEKQLATIPGAGHLFEERGTLEQAARLAREWFAHHLPATETRAA